MTPPGDKAGPARLAGKRGVAPPAEVLTIGHSTRSFPDFCRLLTIHGVTRLIDVRTIPRSRHNPQFNKDALPGSLRPAHIAYQHIPGLGGLRHARPDSPNKAWRNSSFRGYADYMQTPEFAANLDALIELARSDRIALMCAEAVPWRCHRSLIADALVARGLAVAHIMSETVCRRHTLRPWAVVSGQRVIYPAPPEPTEDPPPRPSRRDRQKHRKERPAQTFHVGDHVSWNSEAGRVRGTIKKIVRAPTAFKGYTVRASKDAPQYLIKSDKTDHLAMHKGSALRKLKKKAS